MLLRNIYSGSDGFINNMPDDIWGSEIDKESIDIEIYTKIINMKANYKTLAYTHDDVLDIVGLSGSIYQKFERSWQAMYDALMFEYNVGITVSEDYTREVLDSRDEHTGSSKLLNENKKTSVGESGTQVLKKSGEESKRNSNSSVVTDNVISEYGKKDQFKRSLKSEQKFGSKDSNNSDDVASVKGHNSNAWSDRDKTSSNGQVSKTGSDVNYDTGSSYNQLSGSDDIKSNNTTKDLNYEKIYFNARKDTTATDSKLSSDDKLESNERTIGDQKSEGTMLETFSKTGSSAIKTYPALITEEIDMRTGKAGNFIDIVIDMIIKEIALKHISMEDIYE